MARLKKDTRTNAQLRAQLARGLLLTLGERLLLRRRADQMTQREMADAFGIPLGTYRAWETDAGDVPRVKGVSVSQLTLSELCYILRRRHGIRLQDVALALNRSISWVYAAEGGGPGVERVVDWLTRRTAA